ncbi:hypothetical protein P8605_01505 [Streptomyces sp. T-3]|nr:hypothetical protein [Streptomyces sp. T-3]
MGNLTDGIYRIGVESMEAYLANPEDTYLVLARGWDEAQIFEVQCTNGDNYTIRQASSDLYLGYEGVPDTFERVALRSDRREWKITDGPTPGTFTIAALGSHLTLGLHPALVYPPLIALSPMFSEDRGWTFETAK